MKSTDQLARTHLAPEPGDLARLVAGEHHNPHGILGAHEYGDHTDHPGLPAARRRSGRTRR